MELKPKFLMKLYRKQGHINISYLQLLLTATPLDHMRWELALFCQLCWVHLGGIVWEESLLSLYPLHSMKDIFVIIDEMTSVKPLPLDWHIENAPYMLDPYPSPIPQNTVKYPWALESNRPGLKCWLITYLLGYLWVSFYVSGCPFLGWGARVFLFEGSFPYQTDLGKGREKASLLQRGGKYSDCLPTKVFDLYYGRWPTWAGNWIVLWMFTQRLGIKRLFSSTPSPKHST